MSLLTALKGLAAMIEVQGKPVRDKASPAKVSIAGIPVFERDENGKQHVLFFRIRDVRK